MELQKLRALTALAATGNYSETAERLFTTQSNISKQILSLERELGVKLFDRSHRRVTLTLAGERILVRAETILREYDALLQDLCPDVPVHLMVLPVMAYYGLTGLIVSFQKRWPDIPLQMEEVEGQDLLQRMKQEHAELAICRSDRLNPKEFECLTLCRDRFVAVLPLEHPLARQPRIALNQLQGERLLQIGASSTLYQTVWKACRQAGFSPNICYTSLRIENLLAMIGDGAGVSLMMEQAVRYWSTPGTAAVPLEEEIISPLALTRLRENKLGPSAQKFWEFARDWREHRSARGGGPGVELAFP